ncbi:nuclear transport factor 2 family protein [Candidatus Woesearchaeota archaeon]|nr:nuclear transport factor 2 family protein [Candidatus Woesearchaeota archaeon]
MERFPWFSLVLACLFLIGIIAISWVEQEHEQAVIRLVEGHARAWETGDLDLLLSIVHDNITFAYPGRRLNHAELIDDFIGFAANFRDTKVYISKIVLDEDQVAIEWQFATTRISNGKRQAVSDAIIARIQDGKIISWKEYLDGRVSRMQEAGELPLEEGQEPFPWPRKV